ncbi:Scr1 family TA system antitoxin-like transcriptional regulator [Streptomyces sp. NPDC050485]|uniref:Scr1 family TA system antitoxin-like transcriptional regulator n=1 Tax=Streptomyces sp. NPDC050485 TaxID=3365617 RepID=UPI00379D5A1E
MQESVAPLYRRTRLFRIYQSDVVPGLLQTEDYTRSVLTTIVALRGAPDDIEDAVAVRMARRRILRSSRHRFLILIEESLQPTHSLRG